MIQIFLADGRDGRDQPKVVQEVLADLKRFGQIGHGLGDQFDLLGGHLDNLGQGLNRYS